MEQLTIDHRNLVNENEISDFKHQIAGHINERIKLFKNSLILKPRNKADLFKREVEFYENSYNSDKIDNSLCSLLPDYFGVVNIQSSSKLQEESCPCIVLEDLTFDVQHPCILDIKMGRKTFEPNAPCDKVERELKKYPYQEVVGFRLTGVKVWDKKIQDYRIFGKSFGRALFPHQVIFGLAYCFFDGFGIRFDLFKALIDRCNTILVWMKQQYKYKYICTSLLVVYDAKEALQLEHFNKNQITVHMIDFAHALQNEDSDTSLDEDYIYGLTNLVSILEKLYRLSQASPTEKEEFNLQMMKEMGEVNCRISSV